MLYLISGIVWMILKISSILSIIAGESYKHFIDINLVSVDKIGGLGIIRDIISKIILYYSLAISLIILAYIKPQLYTVVFEIAAFAILLLIGVILLLWGLQSLQRLFRERVVEGFNKINEEYQNQYKNLTEAMSGEMDDEALASITKKIEVLNKEIAEKEKILIENRDKYSTSTAINAAIAFIMPLVSLYEKMSDVGLVKFILKIFNIDY